MKKVILLIGSLLFVSGQIYAQDFALLPLPKEVNWKTSLGSTSTQSRT